MKKYLEMAMLIIAILGAAVELIKSFEMPGFGAEKKELVMELLKKTFEFLKSKLQIIDIVWEDIKTVISGAIDVIVGFFNTVNVFKKG